jgi:hypothetical protein
MYKSSKRLKVLLFFILLILLLILLPWYWITQPVIFKPSIKSRVSVDPSRLLAHVKTISTELSPRDESHPENLDEVASYIREELKRAKANVIDQPYQVDGITYRNVIGQFGPETKDVIVVGAHYDAAGPFPGADDNASGVAGLIELAYLLANVKLPLRVELVAYSLEEPPFFRTEYMGSAIHAKSLKDQKMEVVLMISLEMIGCFSDEPNSQEFPLGSLKYIYPTTGNSIVVVGILDDGLLVGEIKKAMMGASSLPVLSINAPRLVPGIDYSDHMSYWQQGYPGVMITDTAFYRNKRYHTPSDTYDTLDYKRMAMVVDGVYAAVVKIAGVKDE